MDILPPPIHSDDDISNDIYLNYNYLNANIPYPLPSNAHPTLLPSHHSSPDSGSASDAPRTPSPPNANIPHLPSLTNTADGNIDWASLGFGPADLAKILQLPQHGDGINPVNLDSLDYNMLPRHRQDAKQQQQQQGQNDGEYAYAQPGVPFPFADFTFQPPVQSYGSDEQQGLGDDLRFPLSGYPDPPVPAPASAASHTSGASSTTYAPQFTYSPPQAQPYPTATGALKASASPPNHVSFAAPPLPSQPAQQPGQPPKAPAKRRLTPHNTIERRYRRNLNQCIQALRDAVPAVAILDRERWGDRWVPDERGYVDGVRRAGKNSKSVVLEKGVEYIGVLGRRAARFKRERDSLHALLLSLPPGALLSAQWEANFPPADRMIYGADELFRVAPGMPLSQAGADDGAYDDEADEEGDEDWDEEEDEDVGGRKGNKRARVSAEGIAVPQPPPMNLSAAGSAAEAERRKRGRPRKGTNTLSPPHEVALFAAQQAAQQVTPPPMSLPQQHQQVSLSPQRLSPEQFQFLAMQQVQQQQQMRQMQALHQQAAHQQQQALLQQQQQPQGQRPQQQQQQGGGEAPRYLLAAFLCFSIFRSSSPLTRAGADEPATHVGSVLAGAAAPPSWIASLTGTGAAGSGWSWFEALQLGVTILLVVVLWNGWWGLGVRRTAVTGPVVDVKAERRAKADKALMRARGGTFPRLLSLLTLTPSLFSADPASHALLALLLPSLPVFRAISARLWSTAALDAEDLAPAEGEDGDALLQAAMSLQLNEAKAAIAVAKKEKKPEPVFVALARRAVEQRVAAAATARFIRVADSDAEEAEDDDENELDPWAERAALVLGGSARRLLEAWDDARGGFTPDFDEDTNDVETTEAYAILRALALLPAASRPSSAKMALRLRRALGASAFDAPELADARDKIVDRLNPRTPPSNLKHRGAR